MSGTSHRDISAAVVLRRARAGAGAALMAFGRLARRAGRAGYARLGFGVVLVLALTLFTWPVGSVTAMAGLDNSWAVGLSLALSRGLVFGRQVVFTFGPLGLVAAPRAVTGGTLVLGLLGAAAMQLALVAVVLHSLRRRLPWPIAAVITLLGVSIIITAGVPVLDEIAFGVVAIALRQPPARARQAARTLALAGGTLAGLAILVKLNDGLGATAIVTMGLLGCVDRRRNLAIGALAFVLSTSVAWLALGQPITALPDYFSTGLSIVGGYVDAMGYNMLGNSGQWEVLVVIVSAVAFAAAAWVSLSDARLRSRVALAGCVLLVHYFVAREMFVRYEAGHGAVMTLLVAIPLMIPWRRGQLVTGLAMGTGLAALSLAILGVSAIPLSTIFDPLGRESTLVSEWNTMVSPQPSIAAASAAIQAAEGIPSVIVGELNNHCVNAEPWEVSAIFAHPRWRWCPVGVMQSYAAYTTKLDNLDAAGYANARTGPDRVLRQATAIDGRNPTWESPAAMLSLLCHFKQITFGGQWQSLARIPNRCGKPRLLATLHSGGPTVLQIPAPPPGMVLVAQVYGLQLHRRERLETLFARAAVRLLVANGLGYRVVPDTVTDGLVFDVPAYADYSPPFSFNQQVNSLEAEINGAAVPFSVALVGVPIKPA
jgi:hypothetical protein